MRWVCGLGLALLCGALAACGGEGAPVLPVPIRFQRHALTCEVADLEARVQISGVPDICPLDVRPDRSVSGFCRNVPTGEVRAFRLVYFVTRSGMEIELATIVQSIDLENQRKPVVMLDFPGDRIMTSFDDDGDRKTNLAEVCTGGDPLAAGR